MIKKHLTQLAEEEIRELQQQGIKLTNDEIIWINDLARKVENPEGTEKTCAIGRPAKAGNKWLWPFTIQAEQFYYDVLNWFSEDEKFSTFALAYTCAHARTENAFIYLTTREAALEAIGAWAKTLNCTYAELCEALAEILPSEEKIILEEDKEDNSESDELQTQNWDSIIAFLCKHVGETPQFWVTFASLSFIMKMMDTICEQYKADAQEPDGQDPTIKATRELGRLLIKIKRDHQKESNES
jgi:hypothetical protein